MALNAEKVRQDEIETRRRAIIVLKKIAKTTPDPRSNGDVQRHRYAREALLAQGIDPDTE